VRRLAVPHLLDEPQAARPMVGLLDTFDDLTATNIVLNRPGTATLLSKRIDTLAACRADFACP